MSPLRGVSVRGGLVDRFLVRRREFNTSLSFFLLAQAGAAPSSDVEPAQSPSNQPDGSTRQGEVKGLEGISQARLDKILEGLNLNKTAAEEEARKAGSNRSPKKHEKRDPAPLMMGMGGMGGMPGMGGMGGGGGGIPGLGGCPPLYLIFARGTGELQGTLGIVGRPLCNGLKQQISGTECYDVVYNSDAEYMISPGQGGQTASAYMASIASRCPSTKFALGGYSKGAMVVHSIKGQNVVGAVTFGDPLKMQGVPSTKNWKCFCAMGDPVCENGFNVMAHVTYGMQDVGSAVQFLVQAYRSCGGGGGGAAGAAGGSTGGGGGATAAGAAGSGANAGGGAGSAGLGSGGLGSLGGLGGGLGGLSGLSGLSGMGGLGSGGLGGGGLLSKLTSGGLGGMGPGGLGQGMGGGLSSFGLKKRSQRGSSSHAHHHHHHHKHDQHPTTH
ncbi:hypothetical protein [Sporisorium scitamineum]|uniref:cutinase n=1 Tax=Sporisorium scitamineum TaxID=49012 RepID=A0A0F7RZV6_9BASI|nr:hypothetical protein [Sporisorium scitamineum]